MRRFLNTGLSGWFRGIEKCVKGPPSVGMIRWRQNAGPYDDCPVLKELQLNLGRLPSFRAGNVWAGVVGVV